MKKYIFSLILIVAVIFLPSKAAAKSANVLMEASSGYVLNESQMNERLPMASLTKIMTALVIIENCDMCEEVSVSPKALETEGSSMYLKAEERLSIKDLLYGLMLSSGNDAANALAIYLSGDIDSFAEMMNQKATAIGLKNTHFSNPSGLGEVSHYSSAYDLAILTRYALENETFCEIVKTKTIKIGNRTLVNHNKLLWKLSEAIGVKTGYTIASGRCLVSAAEQNGVILICVTLNQSDDWNYHKKAFEEGFGRCKRIRLVKSKEIYRPLKVEGGCSVGCYTDDIYGVVVDDKTDFEISVSLPNSISPNKMKGEIVGVATLKSGDRELACAPLILDRTATPYPKKESIFQKLLQFMLQLFGF